MGPARWAGREPAACQQRIDSAYLAYGTMSILQLMCILAPDAPPHRSTENWGFSKQLYYSSQSVLSQSPSSSSLSSLISHSHLFFFFPKSTMTSRSVFGFVLELLLSSPRGCVWAQSGGGFLTENLEKTCPLPPRRGGWWSKTVGVSPSQRHLSQGAGPVLLLLLPMPNINHQTWGLHAEATGAVLRDSPFPKSACLVPPPTACFTSPLHPFPDPCLTS